MLGLYSWNIAAKIVLHFGSLESGTLYFEASCINRTGATYSAAAAVWAKTAAKRVGRILDFRMCCFSHWIGLGENQQEPPHI